MIHLVRITLWCSLLAPMIASAQVPATERLPTNEAIYEQLAIGCLATAPDTMQTLRVTGPTQLPFLRPALTKMWQDQGRTLFLATPTTDPNDPAYATLHLTVEEANVAYTAADSHTLNRTVTLGVHYTLTHPDGYLIRENRCRDTATDLVPSDAVAGLESPLFPATQGTIPEQISWLKRYGEPALLVAAVGTVVYLFFTVRNDTP